MQKTFGARTDIDYLNFNLFDAQLDIRNLAQADKEYPMTNLFSIDSVKIDLNLTDLLRGKFHTENITVDGVALNTPRTISGELPEKTKKVYNILGDYPDVVAAFLVEKMLTNTKNNAHIEWLTNGKAAWRFMTAGFNKRDFFNK